MVLLRSALILLMMLVLLTVLGGMKDGAGINEEHFIMFMLTPTLG